MLNPKDRRDLKKNYKRMGIFLAIIFVFALVLSYLLILAGVGPIWNGVIIIVFASINYLLFLWICAKLDKKKAKRLEEKAEKDPFTKRK